MSMSTTERVVVGTTLTAIIIWLIILTASTIPGLKEELLHEVEIARNSMFVDTSPQEFEKVNGPRPPSALYYILKTADDFFGR